VSVNPDDLFELADKIRYDLTAAQGKITALKTMLGELTHQLPERGSTTWICPKCGVKNGTEERLQDHLKLVHAL
jgi:hypothetical protein